MANKTKRGLGRGIDALLGDAPAELETSPGGTTLPVRLLEPNPQQPRSNFDEGALTELAESIRQHGLITPITVRPGQDGYYQIIAGERRWRAARMAGLNMVPVNILDADDRASAQMALVENLQREDLNPLEEAAGYEALIRTYGMTQETVAETVGISRPAVANALRLLKLPPSVKTMVEAGTLSAGHARALLPLETEERMCEAAERARELSVRQTEQLVRRLLREQKPEPQPEPSILKVDYLKECQTELTRALGRRVEIRPGKKGGRMELQYDSPEDLEVLIDAIRTLGR